MSNDTIWCVVIRNKNGKREYLTNQLREWSSSQRDAILYADWHAEAMVDRLKAANPKEDYRTRMANSLLSVCTRNTIR